MKPRVPPPCDLVLEPQLGPILLLEIAAVVTRNLLYGQNVQIYGDEHVGATDELIAARDLARSCVTVLGQVRRYRRLVVDRIRHEQLEWSF